MALSEGRRVDLISLEEARAAGLKRFFTGEPCQLGHIAERSLQGQCVTCRNIASIRAKAKNPEKYKALSVAYYERNRDRLCASYKLWAAKNSDRVRDRSRQYYQQNKEHCAATVEKWQQSNPDKVREIKRRSAVKLREKTREKWRARYALHRDKALETKKRTYQKHKPQWRAWYAEYRARKLQAMPAWADRDKILAFYVEARRLTEETGIQHDVDHVIPLKGKNVCGLHVETNLQVISAAENRKKHNRFAGSWS